MTIIRDPDEVLKLIHGRIVGHAISAFEVFGVNSLKTVTPRPSALEGEVVASAAFDNAGCLHLSLQRTRLEIDLARTGGVEVFSGVTDSTSRGPRPTARISLSDGTSLEFKEPAKTKRITFTLVELANS